MINFTLHVTRSTGMAKSKKPKSSTERVREYRKRMREKGLRPVQFWVPDTRSPEFAAEAHRQSLAIAQSPQEEDDMRFVELINDYI